MFATIPVIEWAGIDVFTPLAGLVAAVLAWLAARLDGRQRCKTLCFDAFMLTHTPCCVLHFKKNDTPRYLLCNHAWLELFFDRMPQDYEGKAHYEYFHMRPGWKRKHELAAEGQMQLEENMPWDAGGLSSHSWYMSPLAKRVYTLSIVDRTMEAAVLAEMRDESLQTKKNYHKVLRVLYARMDPEMNQQVLNVLGVQSLEEIEL